MRCKLTSTPDLYMRFWYVHICRTVRPSSRSHDLVDLWYNNFREFIPSTYYQRAVQHVCEHERGLWQQKQWSVWYVCTLQRFQGEWTVFRGLWSILWCVLTGEVTLGRYIWRIESRRCIIHKVTKVPPTFIFRGDLLSSISRFLPFYFHSRLRENKMIFSIF